MGKKGVEPHEEGMSMCVCVYEELALQTSIKAWGGAELTNEHTSIILLTMTSIYTKNVNFMHLALILTLPSYFPLFMCMTSLCCGIFEWILIWNSSRVQLAYLSVFWIIFMPHDHLCKLKLPFGTLLKFLLYGCREAVFLRVPQFSRFSLKTSVYPINWYYSLFNL